MLQSVSPRWLARRIVALDRAEPSVEMEKPHRGNLMKISQFDVGRSAECIVADGSLKVVSEIIMCAAVRASDGKIVRGRRHIDAIRALQEMLGYEGEQPRGKDQGFVTSADKFVSREQAYRLHFPNRSEPDELQSDDLY